MLKRLQLVPYRWRLVAVTLLILLHGLPIFLTAKYFIPAQQASKHLQMDPQMSFVQAESILSVEKEEAKQAVPPLYKVRLDTISQTNKAILNRQDLALLYQDGLLIGKSEQKETNQDTVLQRIETVSKYNHLYQAISFHYAQSDQQKYQQLMSYDYLYVSSTRYGGIQSFHEPETVQHQNWKEIIDRGLHQQLNFEWNDAFHEFHINPNDYYMFPLAQLPIYSQQEELPGISTDAASRVIREIWDLIYAHLISEKEKNVYGSSMPLILISKDGSSYRILYRTGQGIYHEWNHSLQGGERK